MLKKWLVKFILILGVMIFVPSELTQARQNSVIQNPRYPGQPESVSDFIRFTKVAEFGAEDAEAEALIGGPAGLATSNDGTVYILDAASNQVVMYEPDGTFIKRIGAPGDGPGEFNGPRGIFTDGHTYLLVQNARSRRTERFLLDGTFVDTHLMKDFGMNQPVIAGLMGPSTIVYAESQRGKFALKIKVVDMSGEWSESSAFTYEVLTLGQVSEAMMIPPEVTVTTDRIIVAHPYEYQYKMYDKNGKVITEMHRDFEGLMEPYVADFRGNPMVRFFSNVLNPDRIDENWWLGRATWPTNLGDPKDYMAAAMAGKAPRLKNEMSFDLFDNNWKLRYSLNREQYRSILEGRGLIGYDGKGHVFMTSNTGSVVKYRMEVID